MRLTALLAFCVVAASAEDADRPPLPLALRDVGIDQRLDMPVEAGVTFHDETGRKVRLADYLGKRPLILALVYYDCPMLCTQILNGLVSALKGMSFRAGDQFDVVAASFDPIETPELAAKKKESYLRRYTHPETAAGWHFLTGNDSAIRALTQSVGFRYKYDAATKQFAHASGIIVLTPEGKISRYFYGVEYAPRDLRLGLVEASQGKIGSPVDQILLFCYHYDPATGKYGAMVMNMVRLAGLAFVLFLGGALVLVWRREVRHAG